MSTLTLNKSITPREVLVNGKSYKVRGNVFEYKPSVKLWISFKHEHYKPQGGEAQQRNFKTSKTLYMPELQNSITQVMFREHPPIIDWEAATNRALHLVNDFYHGKYHTAIISFESRYTQKKKEQILYYYEFGKLVEEKSKPFDFMSQDWLKYKQTCSNFILEYIQLSEMVIDYQNNKEVHQRTNMYL